MMDMMAGGDFELGLVQLAREASDRDARLNIEISGEVVVDRLH